MNTSYLTPDEARTVFNEWMAEQSKEYTDPDNARFHIVINKKYGIISGLML